MSEFETWECLFCEGMAARRKSEVGTEWRCCGCGCYSMTPDAVRMLDGLSEEGRAIVVELLRERFEALQKDSPEPVIGEDDVRASGGKWA